MVAIPFVIFLVVAGQMIRLKYVEYQKSKSVVENLITLDALSNYVHEAQKERGMTAGFLGGSGNIEELKIQRELSNKHADIFFKIANEKSFPAIMDAIKDVRAKVDKRVITTPEAIGIYTNVIDQLFKKYPVLAEESVLEDLSSRIRSMSILESAKENAGRLRANLNAILTSNKALDSKQYRTIIDLNAGVSSNLRSLALFLSPESTEGLSKTIESNNWIHVQRVFQDVLQKSNQGNFGHDPHEFFGIISSFIDQIAEIVDGESGYIVKNAIEIQGSAKNQLYVLSLTVVALGLAIFAIVFFIVNAFTRTVEQVINDLSDNSLQVSSAAGQISTSSEELSKSSNEQAYSLEEANSSITELTSMVSKNAQNAQMAAEVSEESLQSALKGKKTIQELLAAIQNIDVSNKTIKHQIDKSNSEISDIVNVISEIGNKTNVINDIVFQTKLLSFNASVEAARAGENGKGFAVVAEEVGNLAQMSGTAAQEITMLLEDSLNKVTAIVENSKSRIQTLMNDGSQKVEEGIKVAKICDEVLEEVMTNVKQVGQMAHEISSATNEQDQGVKEISLAMSQLEKMTQVNASTSEETASAAEELAAQSISLQNLVQLLVNVTKGSDRVSNTRAMF